MKKSSKSADYEKMAQAMAARGLFAELPETQVVAILKRQKARLVTLSEGDILSHRGDPSTFFAFVVAGAIQMTVPSANGDPRILKLIKAGEFAGHSLVLRPERRIPCDVTTPVESTVILMDNAATRALLRSREGQPFLHVLMDHLNTALLNLWERNLVVSSYTIGDRVMTYLQMRSLAEGTKEIRLPGNLDGFAAYLGCARPALSRTLAGLIAEGKITRRGKGCYELLVTQPNTTLVKT